MPGSQLQQNFNFSNMSTCEPQHDKTNEMAVHPVKTQISPVWSESSLCTHWVAKDPRFLHADSEDSDQTGRMPRLSWVSAGRTLILLVLSCRRCTYRCKQCRLRTQHLIKMCSVCIQEFLLKIEKFTRHPCEMKNGLARFEYTEKSTRHKRVTIMILKFQTERSGQTV